MTWTKILSAVLTVLVVCGLVIGALIWNIERDRAVARNAYCRANLKSIAADFNLYAAQYRDSFPVVPGTSNAVWLTDQSRDFAGVLCWPKLDPVSALKGRFYCPANSLQNPTTMWAHGNVSVWGYALFNDRGAEAVGMPATFPARMPALGYQRKWTGVSSPAETELALDVIVSESDKGGGVNFTKVSGGAQPVMTYTSSHLTGGKPEGANVATFDGHVEWRTFEAATAVAVKQGGLGEAYFWVPNP